MSTERYCIVSTRRNSYLCIEGSDESGHVRWEPFNKAKAKRKKKWFMSKTEAIWFSNEHLSKWNPQYAIMSESYYDRIHKSMKRMKMTSYTQIDGVWPTYVNEFMKFRESRYDSQETTILWEKEKGGNLLNITRDLNNKEDITWVGYGK